MEQFLVVSTLQGAQTCCVHMKHTMLEAQRYWTSVKINLLGLTDTQHYIYSM